MIIYIYIFRNQIYHFDISLLTMESCFKLKSQISTGFKLLQRKIYLSLYIED